jgi:polysaccharide pyruvyl transferase WcaK-like protein
MDKEKICILGWYGTETMGDRAILDGIFSIFAETYGKCEFYIGSLFPILTERTLNDDDRIYKSNAPDSDFIIFDVKCKLKEYIEKSDLVIMGGGPIMELNELYLIRDGFSYAHKCNKKTVVFGCGLGPLKSKRLTDVAKSILMLADLVIFRDTKSLQYAYKLVGQGKEYFALDDPAVISILLYKVSAGRKKSSEPLHQIAINFREPTPPYPDSMREKFFLSAKELIVRACDEYDKVSLVPMHLFAIGNDDREYFSKLTMDITSENLIVLNKPLDLYELYDVYSGAEACIGMRYHSIVMQTLLNGNNYILDYTENKKGKIPGFIDMLEDKEFYQDYYTNITEKALDIISCLGVLKKNRHYLVKNMEYEMIINNYRNLLLNL